MNEIRKKTKVGDKFQGYEPKYADYTNLAVKLRKKIVQKPNNNLAKTHVKINRTITKTGNSFSINIPPILIKKMGFNRKNVIMEEAGDRIVLYKDNTV